MHKAPRHADGEIWHRSCNWTVKTAKAFPTMTLLNLLQPSPPRVNPAGVATAPPLAALGPGDFALVLTLANEGTAPPPSPSNPIAALASLPLDKPLAGRALKQPEVSEMPDTIAEPVFDAVQARANLADASRTPPALPDPVAPDVGPELSKADPDLDKDEDAPAATSAPDLPDTPQAEAATALEDRKIEPDLSLLPLPPAAVTGPAQPSADKIREKGSDQTVATASPPLGQTDKVAQHSTNPGPDKPAMAVSGPPRDASPPALAPNGKAGRQPAPQPIPAAPPAPTPNAPAVMPVAAELASSPVTSTPGAAPAAPALPMNRADWPQTLVEVAVSELTPDGGTLTLHLSPDDLGELEITVVVEGDLATVSIKTETAEAARMMADSERQLQQEFARNGLTLTQHDSSQADRRPPTPYSASQQTGNTAQNPPAEPAPPLPLRGLVNLIA